VHTLLWALNALIARHPDLPSPSAIRADFRSFLGVGRTAVLGEMQGFPNSRFTVLSGNLAVMMVELRFGAHARDSATIGHADTAPAAAGPAIDHRMGDVVGMTGSVAPVADDEAARGRFPHACTWLGSARVQGLLCSTRLVGMICPGLHSIFNGLNLRMVAPDGEDGLLRYSVISTDQRFRRVKMDVQGSGIAGVLTTSLRAPPLQQPAMSDVAARVANGLFAGSTALVVGGSRGLGEVTAKILAAGGAKVLITYMRGRDDAQALCHEIKAWGGDCRALRFDARDDLSLEFRSEIAGTSHFYYFATPAIFEPSATIYAPERFAAFTKIYVEGFHNVCEALRSSGRVDLQAFYPSSTFVQDRPDGMAEYAMAKIAGEVLCQEMNLRHKAMHVTCVRLPRLPTDQTSGLVVVDLPSALATMLPLVCHVQRPQDRDAATSA
jgi:NAD(P)-dependent dehydrogenase (short-subunit alcohol dehydrogenase family)